MSPLRGFDNHLFLFYQNITTMRLWFPFIFSSTKIPPLRGFNNHLFLFYRNITATQLWLPYISSSTKISPLRGFDNHLFFHLPKYHRYTTSDISVDSYNNLVLSHKTTYFILYFLSFS